MGFPSRCPSNAGPTECNGRGKEKGTMLESFSPPLRQAGQEIRVLEDMALADRFRMTSTPTKIVNGDMIVGLAPDNVLERYLGK
jgi:protein-disulfide isomerase